MKNCTAYLLGILVLFGFLNCANGKKVQKEAPVTIENPYFTTWTGGVKGAGAGLNLYIPVTSEVKNIKFDSVYFRGKKAKLIAEHQNPKLYIAYFNLPGNEKKIPELIMSSDPKEEYGNEPPVINKKIPFELKQDEAVISYKKGEKKGYFKITGIQKKDNEVKIKSPENIRH